MRRAVLSLMAVVLLSSCAVLRDSAKCDFADGVYRGQLFGGNPSRVYIHHAGDSIAAYGVTRATDGEAALLRTQTLYPASSDTLPLRKHHTFYQPSFDVDVLTIPFKFRLPVRGFPPQLNTAFNGALYFGYRTDAYRLHYRRTRLGGYHRATSHYGYSVRVFTGLGATPVNPWVTSYATDREYDGFVLSAGVASIIAVNSLSFGVGAGYDRLMDDNRQHWIYRGQPWIGFLFGLNLN